MSNKDEILAGLEPLFKEAEEKKLWFYCSYQSLWFSPSELRERQEKGSFIWGAVNWELRNPREHIDEIYNRINGEKIKIEELERRILKG